MYSVCLSENKSSQYVYVKRVVSVCLIKNGRSLCVLVGMGVVFMYVS